MFVKNISLYPGRIRVTKSGQSGQVDSSLVHIRLHCFRSFEFGSVLSDRFRVNNGSRVGHWGQVNENESILPAILT